MFDEAGKLNDLRNQSSPSRPVARAEEKVPRELILDSVVMYEPCSLVGTMPQSGSEPDRLCDVESMI